MNNVFISYSHAEGFGNAIIKTKKTIEDYSDIEIIKKSLKNSRGEENVVILNIQKLPL